MKKAVNTEDVVASALDDILVDNFEEIRVIGCSVESMDRRIAEAKQAILDWHNRQIAKAKIDEWNRLISITRINGERVINQATYSLALDRIAELSGRKDRATKTGAEEK